MAYVLHLLEKPSKFRCQSFLLFYLDLIIYCCRPSCHFWTCSTCWVITTHCINVKGLTQKFHLQRCADNSSLTSSDIVHAAILIFVLFYSKKMTSSVFLQTSEIEHAQVCTTWEIICLSLVDQEKNNTIRAEVDPHQWIASPAITLCWLKPLL